MDCQLVHVEARPRFHIHLEYGDGISGEVDLTPLVGLPAFKAWETPGEFEKVHVSDWGSVAWDPEGNLELCPDTLYLRLSQGWYPPPKPARLSARRVAASRCCAFRVPCQ